ncbi:MAG: hypothetical protein U1F66_03420 [bacterium]
MVLPGSVGTRNLNANPPQVQGGRPPEGGSPVPPPASAQPDPNLAARRLALTESALSATDLEGVVSGPRAQFREDASTLHALLDWVRQHPQAPEAPRAQARIRELIRSLRLQSEEIRGHLRSAPGELVQDCEMLRAFYRDASSFLATSRNAGRGAARPQPDEDPQSFQAGMEATSGSLRLLRDQLRLGIREVPGTPNQDQVSNARLIAVISRDLGEHQELLRDVRHWRDLTLRLPNTAREGRAGNAQVQQFLEFAASCEAAGDHAMAEEMLGTANWFAGHRLEGSARTTGLTQVMLWSTSIPGGASELLRQRIATNFETQLSDENATASQRQALAVDQGLAILYLRSQGHTFEPSANLLNALRGGGRILAQFAEALSPQAALAPSDVLASLSSSVPHNVLEDLVVRLGAEVVSRRAAAPQGREAAPDPLVQAMQGFDPDRHLAVFQLNLRGGELGSLSGELRHLTVADIPRLRSTLANLRSARERVANHLSEDPSLRAYQLQSLLQTDRSLLALRREIGGLYGGASVEWLGESEQAFAAANTALEGQVQGEVQGLQTLHGQAVTAAGVESTPLRERLANYRLAHRIDIALDSGNDRVQDLVAWQALVARATDSDYGSSADRFNDLGELMAGFHAMRQRQYDERSLDLRDPRSHWGDYVSYGASDRREQAANLLAASPTRVRMSEADLTAHLRQVQDSMVALLPALNPTSEAGAEAANDLYRNQLQALVQAGPGRAAETVAANVLPLLSAEGLARFLQEPATQQALLTQLTAQANRQLAQGHLTEAALRDSAQQVRVGEGRRPLSDFISGVENGQLHFSPAYEGLSVEDRGRVVQQALHLGRLGEYRAALQAESDPVRRHFRSAMLAFEEGNPLQGRAELQTFLRDSRAPGEDYRLRPAADPQLQAMRTVALDMNNRLMNQALDRMVQISQDLDAQRAGNLMGWASQDLGSNEATLEAMRRLINDPSMAFYSLEETLPVVRQARLEAAQARFASEMGNNTRLVPPGGPDVVDLTNVGNLPLSGPDSVEARQARRQALEAEAYRGMAVVGTVEGRFGAEGLVPELNTQGIYESFQQHPERPLVGVPTVQVPPRGEITFIPHRGAGRDRTSMLRVEVGPQGGVIYIDRHQGGGRLDRVVVGPGEGTRYFLLFDDHGREAVRRGSGILGGGSRDVPAGARQELDPRLMQVMNFESYGSVQQRAQSPEANRRASLTLAQSLRARDGSYVAAGRILEEVMAEDIHRAQQSISATELQGLTRESEAARPRLREEINRRVFEMIDRGMPRPPQSQIDRLIDQAVQQEQETRMRLLVFTRIRGQHDANQLDPVSRQAWETFNDMMDPTGEWLNISDATHDRIADEVVVNLAMTVVSGGLASGAGAVTRLGMTRAMSGWLATEGTNLVGERAALWAAGQGARRYLGRAALWTMGEAAQESGRRVAARALTWGLGVAVEGTAFHASMTGMQATWGYLRSGQWVFPDPHEFAVGAGYSVLMMGSISVGNSVWGRVAEGIGIAPRQVAQMTELGTANRMARQALNYGGQLATEASLMTLTAEHAEPGESFGTRVLGSAGTILQLRIGGRLFNTLTGNVLHRMQAHLEDRILQTRFRNVIQSRLGIDPAGEEGRALLEAMNLGLAQGQSAGHVEGAVTSDNLEALRNAVRQDLGVDPSSESGRNLTAFLLLHVTARAERGRTAAQAIQELSGQLQGLEAGIGGILDQSGVRGEVRSQIRLGLLQAALARGLDAEGVQSLNAGVTLVLDQAGYGNSPEANQLRVSLLALALRSSLSAERLQEFSNHAQAAAGFIRQITEGLYGPAYAATPLGRSLSGELLLWALSHAATPSAFPAALEALQASLPQVRESLQAMVRNLGFTPGSPLATVAMHQALAWALSGASDAPGLVARVETAVGETSRLRGDLSRILQTFGYREGSPQAEGILLALLQQVSGEPGATSAFNRTRLAAYLSSASDFSRQVDFLIAANPGTNLGVHRAQILAWAIQTAESPEALHRMAQGILEGTATLSVGADGRVTFTQIPRAATTEVAQPPIPSTPVEATNGSASPAPETNAAPVTPDQSGVMTPTQVAARRQARDTLLRLARESFGANLPEALVQVLSQLAERDPGSALLAVPVSVRFGNLRSSPAYRAELERLQPGDRARAEQFLFLQVMRGRLGRNPVAEAVEWLSQVREGLVRIDENFEPRDANALARHRREARVRLAGLRPNSPEAAALRQEMETLGEIFADAQRNILQRGAPRLRIEVARGILRRLETVSRDSAEYRELLEQFRNTRDLLSAVEGESAPTPQSVPPASAASESPAIPTTLGPALVRELGALLRGSSPLRAQVRQVLQGLSSERPDSPNFASLRQELETLVQMHADASEAGGRLVALGGAAGRRLASVERGSEAYRRALEAYRDTRRILLEAAVANENAAPPAAAAAPVPPANAFEEAAALDHGPEVANPESVGREPEVPATASVLAPEPGAPVSASVSAPVPHSPTISPALVRSIPQLQRAGSPLAPLALEMVRNLNSHAVGSPEYAAALRDLELLVQIGTEAQAPAPTDILAPNYRRDLHRSSLARETQARLLAAEAGSAGFREILNHYAETREVLPPLAPETLREIWRARHPLLTHLLDVTQSQSQFFPEHDIMVEDPDLSPTIRLIERIGAERLESILQATGQHLAISDVRPAEEVLGYLLNMATGNPRVERFLREAPIEQIQLVVQASRAIISHSVRSLLLDIITSEHPAEHLGRVLALEPNLGFEGRDDIQVRLLSLLVRREYEVADHSPEAVSLLRLFGVDPARHSDFPWQPDDLMNRARLYSDIRRTRESLRRSILQAEPGREAEIEAFLGDLWGSLETMDVADTTLPYTPHGWNHAITVGNISSQIFAQAPMARGRIMANFLPEGAVRPDGSRNPQVPVSDAQWARAEAQARALVTLVGVIHDTGYGDLQPHESKGVHAQYSGRIFSQSFAHHMEAVFGIRSDSPLFREIFLAIERHGSDKPGRSDYMAASHEQNPFLFIIRLADNLDLTRNRMRSIQTHPIVMAALEEMYRVGQSPEFRNADPTRRSAMLEEIRRRRTRGLLAGDVRYIRELLGYLNETTWPHFVGCERALAYRLNQASDGHLDVTIEISGFANAGRVVEHDATIDGALYQVFRTVVASRSLTYGVDAQGRPLPLQFHVQESFRGADGEGHELPLAYPILRPYEQAAQQPARTAPGGAHVLPLSREQSQVPAQALAADRIPDGDSSGDQVRGRGEHGLYYYVIPSSDDGRVQYGLEMTLQSSTAAVNPDGSPSNQVRLTFVTTNSLPERRILTLSREEAETRLGLRFTAEGNLDPAHHPTPFRVAIDHASIPSDSEPAGNRPASPTPGSPRSIVIGDHPYSVLERASTDGGNHVYTLNNTDLSLPAERRQSIQILSPRPLTDAELAGIVQGRNPPGVAVEMRPN